MALNLSTLTSPATSGDVLAEALTTADFLEGVPVLRNLARGSQKGGDAKQDVALNQPKALPLIDGDGYCYLSGVNGNSAETDNPVLPFSDDFDVSVDLYYTGSTGNRQTIFSQYYAGDGSRFFIYIDPSDYLSIFWGGTFYVSSTVVPEGRNTIRVTKSGNTVTTYLNGVQAGSATRLGVGIAQVNLLIGTWSSIESFKGAIFSVTEANGLLNCDFTATNVRHGDTKFKCATGQVVTVNQSGNDPATIIKKPVLRFDGADDGFIGLLNQTIDSGYYFASFSLLGNGGETSGRVFDISSNDAPSSATTGLSISIGNGTDLSYYYNGWQVAHTGMWDDANGDILHQLKFTNGEQVSKVNNADTDTRTLSTAISSEEFSIGMQEAGTTNVAIDLEFLALFSADSVPDEATASKIRNYINNRNNVFDLKDGFGYYFYDAQKAPVGAISSGSSSWNGRIVGSDNGDSDKLATQATANDQPVGDGYVVTFADNSDHLDIPSTTQAGWQIVGTSLGTFVYRVDNDAQVRLNLLGYRGDASYRRTGDLYGVMLLPESASSSDIESARKLLIDRGSLDGSLSASYFAAWLGRNDIVEFKSVDLSSATSVESAWQSCGSLTTFPALNLSGATNVAYAWFLDSSLDNFGAIDARNASIFLNTWRGCTSLTSFPAGAKLGTEAASVNFTSAWQQSGLTSFSTPLPTATNLTSAFRFCTPLVSFTLDELPLVTSVSTTWQNTRFQSFSTKLPKVTTCYAAWFGNSALVDFSATVFTNWNPSSILSGVFNIAWDGCTSLTAQSVENILTSISASGQFATVDGNSGSGAIADAGIDIDYNVATGSLSAATNSAVTSLKAKGWSIIVNNVTL